MPALPPPASKPVSRGDTFETLARAGGTPQRFQFTTARKNRNGWDSVEYNRLTLLPAPMMAGSTTVRSGDLWIPRWVARSSGAGLLAP